MGFAWSIFGHSRTPVADLWDLHGLIVGHGRTPVADLWGFHGLFLGMVGRLLLICGICMAYCCFLRDWCAFVIIWSDTYCFFCAEIARKVCGKFADNLWKICGKFAGNLWKTCGKSADNFWETFGFWGFKTFKLGEVFRETLDPSDDQFCQKN